MKIDFNDPRIEMGIDYLRENLYEFLDENDVDYSLEGRNIGKDFIGISPCRGCGDTKNHAGLHKERLYLSCFKCKDYASPVQMVAYLKEISIKRAVEYLISLVDSDDMDVEQRVKQILYFNKYEKKEDIYFIKEELPINRKITKKDLRTNKIIQDFFSKRGLREEHIGWYDLRIGENNTIIFPIKKKGEIVTYQSRTMKYKRYHTGKFVPHYFAGEDNIKRDKPLILVEGFLDYISVDTLIRLRYKNKISTTSGLVKQLSSYQLEKLENELRPPIIYCMFDSDSWQDYKSLMKKTAIEVMPVILPKGHDPNSMGLKLLDYIFKKENLI
mgnify:CR=1 FL=1